MGWGLRSFDGDGSILYWCSGVAAATRSEYMFHWIDQYETLFEMPGIDCLNIRTTPTPLDHLARYGVTCRCGTCFVSVGCDMRSNFFLCILPSFLPW